MEVENNVQKGMSPEEARYAALRKFGGIAQTKEAYRDARGLPFLEVLLRDARYGLRMLAKAPVFTAAAILTLALGIGASCVMFTIINGVMLRPLPYADPGRLVMLLGAVACVWLIVCANVAGLLLSRATERQKEIAIRLALGATRARLLRQLLTESLVLAAGGGGAGLLMASWATSALVHQGMGLALPRQSEVTVDGRVLAFALAASVMTAVLFGLAPAWALAGADVQLGLRGRDRGSAARRRLPGALVVAEIALAPTLLVGAGLLTRSLWMLQRVDAGMNTENVLTVRVTLPRSQYREDSQRLAFHDELLRRVRAVPGVRAAGSIRFLPLTGEKSSTTFRVEGGPAPAAGREPFGDIRQVGGDYFQAMGIRLRRGRVFNEADDDHRPNVFVINEALARRVWPGEDPIGQRITYLTCPPPMCGR